MPVAGHGVVAVIAMVALMEGCSVVVLVVVDLVTVKSEKRRRGTNQRLCTCRVPDEVPRASQ